MGAGEVNLKVVMEPKIEAHDPQLYRADELAEGVTGWKSVGEEQVADEPSTLRLIFPEVYL